MGEKLEVWLGTMALMVLKTLETIGPQHGYCIARRIEKISGNAFSHPGLTECISNSIFGFLLRSQRLHGINGSSPSSREKAGQDADSHKGRRQNRQ